MPLNLTEAWLKPQRGLFPALFHFAAYCVWMAMVRLMSLTLITYFLMSSHSRFQDISEAYASSELIIVGVGSVAYLVVLKLVSPLTSMTFDEIFTPLRFEKKFLPGFFRGAVLALGIVVAFLLSGFYRYLGFYIQLDEAPLMILSIGIRIAAIVLLTYCDEFIFRQKILSFLRASLSDRLAIPICAIGFCVLKAIQFDLGWMQLLSLFLISLSVTIRTSAEGDFVRGAGFICSLLVIFHPLLGLPVLGNDLQGIVMVKYQADAELWGETGRILTGGLGGPLSSAAVQFLFVLDAGQALFRNRKILWSRKPSW